MKIFENDKFIAIVAVLIICVGSLFSMGVSAKDILLPAITGIFGVVTGMGMKSGNGLSQVDQQAVDAAKVEAAKTVENKS